MPPATRPRAWDEVVTPPRIGMLPAVITMTSSVVCALGEVHLKSKTEAFVGFKETGALEVGKTRYV